MFYNFFPRKPYRYEITLKHGTAREVIGENTIRRMCIACWVTKATEIHAELVILLSMAKMAMRSAYVYK